MYFCRKSRFVYLANPKTGTRSVLAHLFTAHRMEKVGGEHSWQIPDEFSQWPSFSMVRHPYPRMASLYWTALKTTKSFIGYLESTFRPQFPFACDHVVKFEEKEKLSELPFWPTGRMPWANNSRTKGRAKNGHKWRRRPSDERMLTPRAKEIISEKYARDFEVFGYEA